MTRLFSLLLLLVACATAVADDWPQWLGPKRDSVWREKGLVDKFPQGGLPVVWRVPVQDGFSGPAVANGLVYITDYINKGGKESNNPGSRSSLKGSERVLCLRADTGKKVWSKEYPVEYKVSYSKGPRATPTIDGNRAYVLGTMGHLWCFNARTGAIVWSKLLTKEYNTSVPFWGFCGHPLIDGDQLICLVGGKGSVAVSFDKHTGKELWRSLSASGPGYCPPTMIQAGGQRQLVIWHPEAVNGLNPKTGKVYWTVPLKPDYGMSVTAPRQYGDYLYVSGHVRVGALLKLNSDAPGASIAWRGTSNMGVYCCNSTPLIDQGTIYGVCATQGQLRAVDLKTGKRLWQTFKPTTGGRRVGHGTAYIVRVGKTNRYFMFSETGHVILARFTTKEYQEISRMHVLKPTSPAGRLVCWSHPAFANQCIFVRNDKELVCLSAAK